MKSEGIDITRSIFAFFVFSFALEGHRYAGKAQLNRAGSDTPAGERLVSAASRAAALAWLLVSLGCGPPARAMEALRLQDGERIVVDGRLDDAAWARAQSFDDFWMVAPVDKARPPVRTEMRIAYDRDALYVAARAYDPEPDRIRQAYTRRDNLRPDQDVIEIYIDPLGTRKFAQFFRVNALGSVADGAYNEDSGKDDQSPDYEFEAAAARFDGGWSVEFRIPFSTLRYGSPPASTWSVIMFRHYPREQRYLFASSPLPKDQTCSLCLNEPLSGLTDVPDARHLALTPMGTLRSTVQRGTGVARRRENEFVPSLDAKWRPRADTIVDATLNPDFSQVELDTPQLKGNTQFALFSSEKRPFFLEGADILEAPLNAMYTRSVADPAWGARITQRTEKFDGTLLVARDRGGGSVLLPGSVATDAALAPGASIASFARGRWQLGGATLGALATDRTLDDGAFNRVLGADLVVFPGNDHRLRTQFLQSWTTALPDGTGSLVKGSLQQGRAAIADWTFHNDRWDEFLDFEDVSRDFRADNGFVAQSGYRRLDNEAALKFGNVGPFTEVAPYLNTEVRFDQEGRTIYRQPNAGLRLSVPRTVIATEIRSHNRVAVKPGGTLHRRDQIWASVTSTPTPWLARLHAELAYGDQIDVANDRVGRGGLGNATAALRLHQRLELEYRLDASWIDMREPAPGPRRILTQTAQQWLAYWHFSALDNLRAVWQTTSIRREPALWLTPVSARDKFDTVSLVYGHRRGLNLTAYIGTNFARTDNAGTRRYQVEAFAKGSWTFDAL